MVNLFFDVETTGKALMREGVGHPGQPRVVQLATLLVDGKDEVACLNTLVIPVGFEVPEESTAIHGITHEKARRYGLLIDDVLRLFSAMAGQAEGFVAHNIAFDQLVVESEYSRLGHKSPFVLGLPTFCTMKAATPVCHLAGPYGYKWPKLSEAYRFATGRDLVHAHDALADIRATVVVYNWLMKQLPFPPPPTPIPLPTTP